MATNAELTDRVEALTTQVAAAETALAEQAAAAEKLQAETDQLEGKLGKTTLDLADAEGQVAALREQLAAAEARRDEYGAKLDALQAPELEATDTGTALPAGTVEAALRAQHSLNCLRRIVEVKGHASLEDVLRYYGQTGLNFDAFRESVAGV